MKKLILFVFLFSLASADYLKAQSYGLDNTDPIVFTKFRVPDTDLKSLWLNSGLNFYSNKQAYYLSSNYNSDFNYYLMPRFYLLQESDERLMNFNASLAGEYSHTYSESFSQGDLYTSTNSQNTYNESLLLDFTLNNYLKAGDIFYSIGSTINVSMMDSKREQGYGVTTSSYYGSKLQNYIISLGAGIGKLRNVTPVVSAVRFQERLKQLNLLNTNLSESTIENLAQQFYRQDYYNLVHDRPDKFFWQSIEKTLADDGISLSGLNMYADSYLKETVNEVRFIRQEGMIAGVEAQFNYGNYYNSSAPNKIVSEEFYAMGSAYIFYSHQMDLNSQINFSISTSGGPNVINNPVIRQQYSLQASARYSYELTDRLVTTISDSYELNFWNAANQQRGWQNQVNINATYFIEDYLSVNGSYNWSYLDSRYFSTPNYNTGNQHNFNIGFAYYFERGLLIP